MLRITKVQVEAFSSMAVEDYVRRMRDHLRDKYPARTSGRSDAAIDRFTHAALTRAPRYNFESEYDICRFAELLVELGPDFEELPEVRAILSNTELDSDDRFDLVISTYQEVFDMEV